MNKLPTGEIIARSYGFAFGNFFGILGIVWLPLFLELLGLYFLMPAYFSTIGSLFAHLPRAGDTAGPPEAVMLAMQSMYRYALLFVIGVMFLRAMMLLGITRKAFGLPLGSPGFVFFSLGKDVWRLFGTYVLFYIIMLIGLIVVEIVVLVPAAILAVVAALLFKAIHLPEPVTTVLAGLGILAIAIVLCGAIFYFTARLLFLLTPSVVLEKHLNITRAWDIAKGNVWRIFLICVAIILPLVVIYGVTMIIAALSIHLPSLPIFQRQDQAESALAMQSWMAAAAGVMHNAWPIFLPIVLIFSTLIYGILGGAMTFCYRALVPQPPKSAGEVSLQPG